MAKPQPVNIDQAQVPGFDAQDIQGKASGILEQVEPLFAIEGNFLHFMFSKQSVSPEIVAMFNEGLRTLHADGTYQRLFEKHGLDNFSMLRECTID